VTWATEAVIWLDGKNGPRHRQTLGEYSEITLEAVRSTANAYLDQAKRGIDPGQALAHTATAGGLLIEQLAKDFDGPAAERRKAGGGGMTKLLLPGLRPVRQRLGFAAAQEDLMEKISR
jgi:hypothetical protein